MPTNLPDIANSTQSNAADEFQRRPLRIGFDLAPSSSGPGRYVNALIRGLREEGREPVIVNPAVRCTRQVQATSPATDRGRASGGFSSRGLLSVVPGPFKVWAGFGRDALGYARHIAAQHIDLMHLQKTGCEESPVAARLAGVPTVVGTFHVNSSLDLAGVRSGLTHRTLEWVSNRSVHRAIAVSEATRQDWIRRTGIAGERVVTIHNGIEPEQFRRRRSQAEARGLLSLPQDALLLCGLGRLDAVKGFEDLIEALALLRPQQPKAMVAIAGTGPLAERLDSTANRAGVSDGTRLLGFQADVSLVLDACDVFVISSYCEALPFALLEAMAHELPAVGTSVGGIPEVIVHGQTGFLVPPRNPAALAAAIGPLLASVELRTQMGRAARQRVEKHFHEADMVRKTLDVYRSLLQNVRRR
jgi:glycosyltransferase involved in cell wall biosynthesis